MHTMLLLLFVFSKAMVGKMSQRLSLWCVAGRVSREVAERRQAPLPAIKFSPFPQNHRGLHLQREFGALKCCSRYVGVLSMLIDFRDADRALLQQLDKKMLGILGSGAIIVATIERIIGLDVHPLLFPNDFRRFNR